MKDKQDLRRVAEKSLLAGAVCLYLLYLARNAFRINGEVFFSLFDDAMISMRYAQNLAEGHGLLWNIGEEPVEGYTNFLWTLLMAGAHLLGLADSKVSLVVILIAGACLVANAFVVRRIADQVSGGKPLASVAAVALTLFSYPLIFWSLRGMEVGFLTLIVDVGILASLRLREGFNWRQLWILCVACMLAVLTRPDSVGPVFVLGAFTVLMTGARDRLKVALTLAASVGATLAGHTAFRVAYYHDTLPNTYYLKVFGTPLSARLLVGIPAFLRTVLLELWPLLLLPLVLLIRSPGRLADRGRQMLLLLLLGQCAYSVYVGGDAWEHLTIANRYISIVLGGAFALIGALVADLLEDDGDDLRFVYLLIGGAAMISLLAAFVYHFAVPLNSARHVRLKLLFVYVGIDAVITAAALYIWKKGLPSSPLRTWVLLLVPLWLGLDAMGFVSWKKNDASNVDEEMTRLGMAVKAAATRPDARIAVTYAGAPPYFSRLPSADLLGKCDRAIAHQRSYLPFLPGHSKWNYPYSIETYHPDLILQTFRLNAVDRAFLAEKHYVRFPNGVYFLDGSTSVNRGAVEAMPFKMHHIFEEL